jgi:acetoin utilization protein AcuB
MSKTIPTVQRYMTPCPHSIGAEQKLEKAHALMSQHAIRHLPVLRGGELVGVLSERDLHFIETLLSANDDAMTIEDAMSDPVFTVPPDAPLDEVAGSMAERKCGCAVVVQNQKVVGIFTTVDACRALQELLQSRLAKPRL